MCAHADTLINTCFAFNFLANWGVYIEVFSADQPVRHCIRETWPTSKPPALDHTCIKARESYGVPAPTQASLNSLQDMVFVQSTGGLVTRNQR